MKDSLTMLPVAPDTFSLDLKPFLKYKMPRVVPDQRSKFENDEFFRKLSRESEIRFTGYKDRPHHERQARFEADVREGHADIAFTNSGTNFVLNFLANVWSDRPEERVITKEFLDFEKEVGKVHLKSQFILNGVCVLWRGWVDLTRLDGVGYLQYDDERAQIEDNILRDQIEQYNQRIREFEERHRQIRQQQERHAEQEVEQRRHMAQSSPSTQSGSSGE
ncbi:unnamed protein product [Owenia fusiformis]|uniref:Uncharacterized protein n=1 Tax=Owenia fusiformis TaxID=6347 RepID=A0A8J1Y8C0_OWEFU|nr:unnamed protein product [Owenia fusiformis]